MIRQRKVFRNGEQLWEAPPSGEVQEFLRAGYDRFSGRYPKFHKMDNLSKLGWLAAEVLLRDTAVKDYRPEQVALVLANRSASLDTDLRYYNTVKDIASPALFVYTLPNIMIGEICIRHGFKGEHAFFTADSFDVEQVTAYTQLLLGTGAAEACICGWVEVMEQQYDAALYLVEKQAQGTALPFTAAEAGKLYETEHDNVF